MKDGRPDKSKFECEVKTGLDSSFSNTTGIALDVVAILPVANEPKALEILVAKPLRDNANASIKFRDKRASSSIDTTNTVNFRLADAREPSVLAVESTGTKTIDITFSEAVLAKEFTDGTNGVTYEADDIRNYLIDGRSLADWGITQELSGRENGENTGSSSTAIKKTGKEYPDEKFSEKDGKVTVHSYKVEDKTGVDNRHKVTITVGSGHVLSSGTHMLTIKNVGDWAAQTDGARNSVSTQVLPFTITENAEKPDFTVNVQSPEQYELNFNTEFKVADQGERFTSKDTSTSGEKSGDSVLVLQERINGAWTTISNGTSAASASGQNPLTISRVGGNGKKFVAEVRRDWSEVYDFERTRTDYYNKELRLHIDAGKLVNVSNNLRNDEINIELNTNDAKVTNGNIMKEADLTSPTVVGITQAEAENGTVLDSWNVEFSEPVKISGDANKETLTPSQKQKKGVNKGDADLDKNEGVPVAFARFVNVDNPSTIVEGIVQENYFIDAEDKVINVAPEKKLSAGSWRLVVGSVSDDYGSTLATDGQVIEITADSVTTNFKIVWAAVATEKDYSKALMGNVPSRNNRGSYVFVKFNKAVDLATALDENNYALNNQPLPHGANIYANIENYDDQDSVVDSVTIALPTSSNLLYQDYTVDTLSTQLSINGVVAAGTGEALSGRGMTQLPYNIGQSSKTASNPGVVYIDTDYVNDEHDAVWGNADSEKSGHKNFKTIEEYYRALRAALDDDRYRAVEIDENAFKNFDADKDKKEAAKKVFGEKLVLEINRPVDIDLNKNVFPGNIIVSTTDAVSSMTIKNGTIKGVDETVRSSNASLTVNAGFIKDFVLDDVTVLKGKNDYEIVLNNVYTESFKTTGATCIGSSNEGEIYVTDADGFGFRNDAGWTGRLTINSNGKINLKGSFRDAEIYVKQAAVLNLGMVDEKGNVMTYPENTAVDIAGAYIRIEGPEAKVMLTKATTVINGTAPKIVAAAKDVKVYSSESDFAESSHPVTDSLSVDGGNVIEIDANGKKVDAANARLDTDEINKRYADMEKIFRSVELLSVADGKNVNGNYDITLAEYSAAVSGGALITSETINKAALSDAIATDIKDKAANKSGEYYLTKENGKAIETSDLKISFSVSGSAKIFTETNEEIKPNAEAETGSSIITINLVYNGKTYSRTIKITKK